VVKKIIVIGSNGMLGQMVSSFFKREGFDIVKFNKRFDENSIHGYLDEINSYESSLVINCVGKIKQKSSSAYDLFTSNTILPLELSRSLKDEHFLIHPSTDCVFDGTSLMPYSLADNHTANDIYGISKSFGEIAIANRPNSLVIRVSIIGPDVNSSKGLLSWFLSNSPNSKLNGFTNHFWNGITTLEWCKRLKELISEDNNKLRLKRVGLLQLGTLNTYSKYEMLCLFQEVFKTKFKILPFLAEKTINRCLSPVIASDSLEQQLFELREFMDTM
jgi:dTDP-4-dehydrorhamnose reductase